MKRKYYYQGEQKTKKRRKDLDEDIISENSDDCNAHSSSKTNNVYSNENHIYFNSSFNKKSVEMLINKIKEVNNEFNKLKKNKLIKYIKPKPIYLHITSYGGTLLHCFKVIDAIKISKMDVYTIVEGFAASCGSLLAVVGKKRYMGKYACILMHQLSGGICGTFREVEDEYFNKKFFMNRIINIYIEHTKMNKEEIEQQLKHDSWWGLKTCLDKGLVDEEWLE
jgi:ATP-dependent Clp protease protease subunit